MIVRSFEIARTPVEVFAYIDQLERHHEWQEGIASTTVEGGEPTRVGTRMTNRRRIPGGEHTLTYEITEHDPPRRSAFSGVDGPVRPHGSITVEPLDGASRSRVTFKLDFKGHGLGKLITPLVHREAGAIVTRGTAKLKELLERGV